MQIVIEFYYYLFYTPVVTLNASEVHIRLKHRAFIKFDMYCKTVLHWISQTACRMRLKVLSWMYRDH
jgi:hypothetical protein